MKKTAIVMLLLMALMLMCSADAVGWSGYVASNTTSWQISRHSENITMDISGHVDGRVSAVERNGRLLSSYASYFKDVSVNDADVAERTAAHEGTYTSEDLFKLRSRVSSSGYELTKDAGSLIWVAEFYGSSPLKMNSSRSLEYSGLGINDREFVNNAGDSIRESSLYSPEFSKQEHFNLSQRGMNATILATNYSILSAILDENKELDYGLDLHSTGIADLSFKHTGRDYQLKSGDYAPLSESEERYVGDYRITRHLRMKSNYTLEKVEDDSYLPCCSGGYAAMNPRDRSSKSWGSVFDCTCFKIKGA